MSKKMYAMSINLEKLIHAKIVTKKGANALVIPLAENHIFAGEKGAYINATIFVNEEVDQYGNIGSIKQNSQGQKKWTEMSNDEKEAHKEAQKLLPYIGNIKEHVAQNQSNSFEEAPVVDPERDELPF